MKYYVWIVLFLVSLGALAGVLVRSPHARPRADCTGRVVIGTSLHGQPVECVCIGGVQSTCFAPGP
jgi:hypothetical protein